MCRGEEICLFTADLIKTVTCRELSGPQSMRSDLESQIESHLTRVQPLSASGAGDRRCCPSAPPGPGRPPLGLPARPRPSRAGCERLNPSARPPSPHRVPKPGAGHRNPLPRGPSAAELQALGPCTWPKRSRFSDRESGRAGLSSPQLSPPVASPPPNAHSGARLQQRAGLPNLSHWKGNLR